MTIEKIKIFFKGLGYLVLCSYYFALVLFCLGVISYFSYTSISLLISQEIFYSLLCLYLAIAYIGFMTFVAVGARGIWQDEVVGKLFALFKNAPINK